MTTNELISKLEAKIFDADMESVIRELYERLSQNGGSYEIIERDHAMAEQVLSDALTGVQKNLLARYQQVAVDRTQKAVKYGFIGGAASCIQIYHETINGTTVHAERLLNCWLATNRKFEVCVTDTAPSKGMRRHCRKASA